MPGLLMSPITSTAATAAAAATRCYNGLPQRRCQHRCQKRILEASCSVSVNSSYERGTSKKSSLGNASPQRLFKSRRGIFMTTLVGVAIASPFVCATQQARADDEPPPKDKDCKKKCVKECLEVAPGSKDYCELACADSCDNDEY